MSQQTVTAALNRLLATQRYSLVNYLSDAPPWTRPGNEELVEATLNIAEDHEHYAQRLADTIGDRRGVVVAGGFPMSFLSLNDLAWDYLLCGLIEDQQRNIQAIEQCVTELVEDPPAWGLAREVLGSEQAHLETLTEFAPQTKPVANSGEIRPRAA